MGMKIRDLENCTRKPEPEYLFPTPGRKFEAAGMNRAQSFVGLGHVEDGERHDCVFAGMGLRTPYGVLIHIHAIPHNKQEPGGGRDEGGRRRPPDRPGFTSRIGDLPGALGKQTAPAKQQLWQLPP
ncbi:uncharacterized protein CIMG_13015 [Coccidioides immitis RS]|uniref:Uncharacterized protein n=1 Tax=Coccidioides immitis (strain RS) TaxID=246410 RepID=A0A0D8JT28_COCIM|nr:uncharacterized protein CIMG_13015 [Coccidioides immitis RS]KJF60510.1 hypothetical protein CIMG_13015 [Coccidioides immitis RS]